MSPEEIAAELDGVLLEMLGEDLLAVLFASPRVPSFAAETVRPPRSS